MLTDALEYWLIIYLKKVFMKKEKKEKKKAINVNNSYPKIDC